MANEEQVQRFVKSFMGMAQNIRLSGMYSDEMSRKVCLLHNLVHCCETENSRPLTITDVSKISGMALSNVSRFLRPLEEKGYVERRRDGRTIYLSITPEGERLYNEKIADIRRYLGKMLGALTEDETAIFLDCSEKISAALDNLIQDKNKQEV